VSGRIALSGHAATLCHLFAGTGGFERYQDFATIGGPADVKSSALGAEMSLQQTAHPTIISGWKDIANYLGKGVRTVQRYERELGLPVRRPTGKSTGSVIATKAELDAWVTASPIREVFRLPRPADDIAAPLKEFRQHIQELHRLREESAQLRKQLHASLESLHSTLQSSLSRQTQVLVKQSSKPRRKARLLMFDAKRSTES